MKKINVKGFEISLDLQRDKDFISLTDIAKYKEIRRPEIVIQNWFKNKHTIEFLGIWEKINNPNFKHIEFDVFKNKAGSNSFILPPTRWVEKTNAVGVIVKRGRDGGTYAHKYIALAFASWISPEFELYLVSEFDRLKNKENDWNIKRTLTKINYRIHTDAINNNLIPKEISIEQRNKIYASEADLLNVALFGITASEWKEKNQKLKGNVRDYVNISQLVCLSNLENLNAHFIKEGFSQGDRLVKLNEIAIEQMKLLVLDRDLEKLEK